MTDHLSQDVFDVITSSTPKIQEAGWRMLQTLLEQKMMSVDTIVPSTGKKLFEGLVEHILSHHKGVHPMFSRKGVQQWLKATDGRAFSLPNSQGGWLPFQVLATIASWDAKQKRDKEIGATALDGWMTAVLPLLPPQAARVPSEQMTRL